MADRELPGLWERRGGRRERREREGRKRREDGERTVREYGIGRKGGREEVARAGAEVEITAGHQPFSEQIVNMTDKSTPHSAILAAGGTRICVQYISLMPRRTCNVLACVQEITLARAHYVHVHVCVCTNAGRCPIPSSAKVNCQARAYLAS